MKVTSCSLGQASNRAISQNAGEGFGGREVEVDGEEIGGVGGGGRGERRRGGATYAYGGLVVS